MTSRHARVLSRTTIPAALALLMLSAAAAPANAAGKTRTPEAADRTLGFALMSAVVSETGTLLRGSGVKSVKKLEGSGSYEVIFERNVRACTYVASLTDEEFDSTQGGTAGSAPRGTNAAGVYVDTRNGAGVFTDLPFSLIVFCAR